MVRILVFGCILLCAAASASAASPANLVPNGSFEQGDTSPDGWSAFAIGGSEWSAKAHTGERSVAVTGLGDDVSWWSTTELPAFERNQLYRLSYWLRRAPDATGGTCISGLDWVNHDASSGVGWARRAFYFRTPNASLSSALFRLGQWHVKGTVFFDDVRVSPAFAVHSRPPELGQPLGEGERMNRGQYTASHRMGAPGTTDFRPLEHFTAHFNSNRWVFSDAGRVVYRHRVGRFRQEWAEVEVAVNYHVQGSLLIEASADGERWFVLGEIGKVGRAAYPIPAQLLPAHEVWVRLRTAEGAELQVDTYVYESRMPHAEQLPQLIGRTQYLTMLRSTPDLEVEILDMGLLRPGRGTDVELRVRNRGPRRSLSVELAIESEAGGTAVSQERVPLSTGSHRRIALPYTITASGQHRLELRVRELPSESVLWEVAGEFLVPPLYDARGGKVLRASDGLTVWWCAPEWKVSRDRPVPTETAEAVAVSAAANEYEPFQLVLSPSPSVDDCRVEAGELVSEAGVHIPAPAIRVVDYVLVERPTDEVGAVGWWPDPLPAHDAPLDIGAGENQSFWVTVHAPAGTPPGDYRGEVTVTAGGEEHTVPLVVHVWDFELPERTHLRSGFGLWSWLIRRYHNLETDDEVREVYRLYLRDFAEHRVAPLDIGRDIEVSWEEDARGELWPKFDVTGFEEDARFALDELGFNSFSLDLGGLGGGTYHSRHLGEIAGYTQGTPEHEQAFTKYARAVQNYLEQRGWLDEAYVYWFDEPSEDDYAFVRDGMELIHRAAPKITRLLTEHPDARLYGAVDIWCIPTFTLDAELARKRQAAGEEMWWYLCTAPKAPHFTLFLDHYGTEIRLWGWESWKYGLEGLLVWETNYWTSGAAYPEPALQNPWEDPMSWQSGYSLEEGGRRPWGNGDGRFLYPPNRDPLTDDTKYLRGPVPSIRWELLRDGIEDYEYFRLLSAEIERLKQSAADPASYQAAEELLEVPAEVCASLTSFATTPDPIHEHRLKLAEAIEELRRE